MPTPDTTQSATPAKQGAILEIPQPIHHKDGSVSYHSPSELLAHPGIRLAESYDQAQLFKHARFPRWRVVHDPEEIHQFCGFMAVLGACGPSVKKPGKFWWHAKSTPVSYRSDTNYCDTIHDAMANTEQFLSGYIQRMLA